MKRFFAFALAAALLFGMCACTQVPENPSQPETTVPTQGVDSPFTEVERDENGNIIRTLEGERGKNSLERFYDAAGALLRELAEREDGHREERNFYPNGKRCNETHFLPDGTVIYTEFVEAGYRVLEDVHFPDGRQELVRFDENDNPVSMRVTEPDGSVAESFFNEKGIVILEEISMADGVRITNTYFDDGTRKLEQHQFPDGSCSEREYDPEGAPVRDIFIDPAGNVQDNLAPNEPSDPTEPSQPDTPPQGTLVGSVTQEGDYTVVVLGKDNWSDYLEEYMDVLIIPEEDRVIIRKYFLVKSSVGQVDADRSNVRLQYIYEERQVACTVDAANKALTSGNILHIGDRNLSFIELEQFVRMSWQYVDGKLVGYGLSCSACEISCSGTSYGDSAIVDIHWIEGTLYLKN